MTESFDAGRAAVQSVPEEAREMLIVGFIDRAVGLSMVAGAFDDTPGEEEDAPELPSGIRFLSGLINDRLTSVTGEVKGMTPEQLERVKARVRKGHESGRLGIALQRNIPQFILSSVSIMAGYQPTGSVAEEFGDTPTTMREYMVQGALTSAISEALRTK